MVLSYHFGKSKSMSDLSTRKKGNNYLHICMYIYAVKLSHCPGWLLESLFFLLFCFVFCFNTITRYINVNAVALMHHAIYKVTSNYYKVTTVMKWM